MTKAKATAHMHTRMVRRMVEVAEEQQVVVLSLSQEEAETLMLLVRNVGGCSTKSRRKHADAISAALQSVGVQNLCQLHGDNPNHFFKPASVIAPHAVYFRENV